MTIIVDVFNGARHMNHAARHLCHSWENVFEVIREAIERNEFVNVLDQHQQKLTRLN